MTVGARLRGRRGRRGRGRREGDEEPILEQLELDDAAAAESTERPGSRSARRVHLAVLPERYEPLEEPVSPSPVPGDKPKRRYRQKLKKYGKVGPAHCPGSGCGVRPGGSPVGHESPSPPCACAFRPPAATPSPAFTASVPRAVPLGPGKGRKSLEQS